jgi:multimeric flavodoxin WrbA
MPDGEGAPQRVSFQTMKEILMKVVCVTASPRRNGNSSTLAGWLLEELKETEIRRYNLWDMQFRGCRGCMACRKTSESCTARDDATPVLEDIARADVTILASPIYMHYLNGEMKSLVDRFFSYLSADHFKLRAAGETKYIPSRLAQGKTVVPVLAHGRPEDYYLGLDATLRDMLLDKGFTGVEILRGYLLNSARDILSREDLREKVRNLAAKLRALY